MPKNIVNINNLDWQKNEHGDFAYEDKWLAEAAGSEKLGASLYRLMPGKKTFPYHFHAANEEAIYILEGTGTLRLNNKYIEIKQGDYISFPVGENHAHQMINTSNAPLIYLCFSTMIYPGVVEYPDSQKVGLSVRSRLHADEEGFLRLRFRKKDAVDYFDGEK